MLRAMHGSIDGPPPLEAPLGRALVLTGSVGSGHTRAASAVAEAMLRSGDARDVEVIDVLAHALPAFRALYRDAYVALIERARARLRPTQSSTRSARCAWATPYGFRTLPSLREKLVHDEQEQRPHHG